MKLSKPSLLKSVAEKLRKQSEEVQADRVMRKEQPSISGAGRQGRAEIGFTQKYDGN